MAAIIDYRGKSPNKVATGIPLITAKVVKRGRIETPDEFIDPAEYDSWMRRGLPRAGDILITTEAPLGEVARLDGRRVALAQRLICLRAKDDILDDVFLKYLMLSEDVQEQLRARSTGTTVLGIKQSELRKVTLTMPALDAQRAIGRVLGALDDKIELNRSMNDTLEAMARAIFKSWFVDFDPVRAKAEGRAPAGMDAATAALFPDGLEASELGEIPSGWRTGTLGDVADAPRRLVDPGEIDGEMAYIGLEHMPRRSISLSEWETASKVTSQKARFEAGEILFGKLRPYFHKVGVAPLAGVCSTDIIVALPKEPEMFGLVLGHLSSDEVINYSDQCSTGTKMPRVSWSDLAKFPVVLPAAPVAGRYTNIVGPMISKIVTAIHESRTLAALRDALLPKLLSGEVHVRDAEVAVEQGC